MDRDKEIVSWYIIRFLDTFKKMSGLSDEKFSELLFKYDLATGIEESFDDIKILPPEEYSSGLLESLEMVGERI